MSSNLGFGQVKPQPKVSQRTAKRAEAAQQYDKMKAKGIPEFEIYIRIRGKKQWYPVGVVAVKRSSQINAAIYDSQADLLQGAFRLFPVLRKNQGNLEYGYRLKEFKDEPIQVAQPPAQKGIGGLQTAFAQLRSRLATIGQKR